MAFVSQSESLQKIHGKFYIQKHYYLGVKTTETVQNAKRLLGTPHTLKPLWAGNRLRKLLSCKHWIHFIEKNNSEGKTQSCGEWFLGSRADHRIGNMFPVGLQNCFGPVTIVFLTFFFIFEQECGYLMPAHCCILGLGREEIMHIFSLQVFKVKAMVLKELYPRNHMRIALSAPGYDLDDKLWRTPSLSLMLY